MDVTSLDHVALRIPEDGVKQVLAFYGDALGLELENVDRYDRGDLDVVSARVSETGIIHFRPVAAFESPTDHSYDHLAITVADSIEDIKRRLREAGIEITVADTRLGATGTAPAVYVRDPFGYRLEIKTAGGRVENTTPEIPPPQSERMEPLAELSSATVETREETHRAVPAVVYPSWVVITDGDDERLVPRERVLEITE